MTDDASIKCWWEIIFSVYWMVSLHTQHFCWQALLPTEQASSGATPFPFNTHRDWQADVNWKSTLNNLRLIIDPFVCCQRLKPWLSVFEMPGLPRFLHRLMNYMHQFRAGPIPIPVKFA
ncbi:MAG: hypothetical protein F6K42_32350 [Leptolyngbya sp. SIO1D8]|nr:hypothetical protein [Leptolyngbya sp. SIO1D8]